jgi:hypothetical protein
MNEERMTNEDVLTMVKENIRDFERKDIIDRYRVVSKKPMTDILHKTLIGRSAHLIQEMTLKGATKEELQRAIEYSMVCIDSKKHSLDVEDCYKDLKIKELLNKYDDKFKTIGTPEKRKRMHEMEKARKRIFSNNVQELKKEGFNNEEIARILRRSEEFVKHYLENQVEE